MPLEVGRDELCARTFVADVDRERRGLELGCRSLEALDRARGQREREPLLAEHPRDRETDPGRTSRHERARHVLILPQHACRRAADARYGRYVRGRGPALPAERPWSRHRETA